MDQIERQLIDDSKPMTLTDLFIKHNGKCIVAQISLLVLISLGAYLLGYFELSPSNLREFLIWDHETCVAWDKMTVA